MTLYRDPLFIVNDILTDVGTQGTDATETNIHAMAGMTAGRKPHMQTCDEALEGAAESYCNIHEYGENGLCSCDAYSAGLGRSVMADYHGKGGCQTINI